MKKLVAMLLTLAMVFSLWTVPVVTAADTTTLDTVFTVEEMLINYEFNDATTALDGLKARNTMPTADGESAVFAKNVGGVVGFSFAGNDEKITALETAMAKGEVAFEYRMKADGNAFITLANGLLKYTNQQKIQVNGTNVSDFTATAGNWIKVTVVVDYSTGSGVLKNLKINDTDYDCTAYTLPVLTAISGSSGTNLGLWTYMTTSYADADSVLYLDYFRIYSVAEEVVEPTPTPTVTPTPTPTPVVVDTIYDMDTMVIDYEFNDADSLNGLHSKYVLPTLSTVDGNGVAVMKKSSTGTAGFSLKNNDGTNESIVALKNALAAGKVAFEYRIKSTGKLLWQFANTLSNYSNNNKISIGGREAVDVTTGDWVTVGIVVDYTSGTGVIKEAKVNDTEVAINDLMKAPALDDLVGNKDSCLWTYIANNSNTADDTEAYVDYFRVYSVAEEVVEPTPAPTPSVEVEYDIDTMLMDYEFNDATTGLDGLSAKNALPTISTVEGNSVAVLTKEASTTNGFILSDATVKTNLATAFAKQEIAFEFKMKAQASTAGKMHARLAQGLVEYDSDGKVYLNGRLLTTVTASDWVTVELVVDYTGDAPVYKTVKVNDTECTLSSLFNPVALDNLVSSNAMWTYTHPSWAATGSTLYLDYFRVYSVKEEAEEPAPVIETEFDMDTMLMDYEFNNAATGLEGLSAKNALPTISTVEGNSVAVITKEASTTNGFILSDATVKSNLAEAFAKQEIAFEFKMKAVNSDAGKTHVRLAQGMVEFDGSKVYLNGRDATTVIAGDWVTVELVVDYTGDAPVYKTVKVNDTECTLSSLFNPVALDNLVSSNAMWTYTHPSWAATGSTLYLDYFRVYSVVPEVVVPDYVDTAYEVKEMLYGYEFNDENGLSGMNMRYTAPTLSTVDGNGVAIFEKTTTTSGNIGVDFPKTDDRATALEAAFASDEIVFETRIKPEGKVFARIFGVHGNGSAALVEYAGNDTEGENDWFRVFGRNKVSFSNTERDWIKFSIVMDYTSGTGMIKELKINDEIINTSDLNSYIYTVEDFIGDAFLWTFVYPAYSGETCKLYMDYLRIYSIDDASNSSIIRRIDAAKRAELAKVDYYSADWALNTNGSFVDLTYAYAQGAEEEAQRLVWADRAEHLARVKGMAAEYADSTSENYLDAQLYVKLSKALTYYVNAKFDCVGTTGNWSNALENPKNLADVFVILKNTGVAVDADLLATAKTNYFDLCESNGENDDSVTMKNAKVFAYNTSNLPVTCNLWMTLSVLYDTIDNMTYIPKIYTELAKVLNKHVDEVGSGVLAEDAEEYSGAGKGVSYFGDGLYPDGSYLGHGPMHYTFGYGRQFLAGCVKFIELAAGTEYQPEADKLSVLTDLVLDNMRWLIRGDNSEFTGIGRSVELYTAKNGSVSGGMINDLIGYVTKLLSEPNIPRKNELAGFLAELRENSTASNPNSYINGNKHFWSSDLMAHQRDNYFAGVKMSSTRTRKTERVGEAGKNTFYLSDGVTPIMVDGKEYEEAISVWDWTRLPGLTALHTAEAPELPDMSHEPNDHYGSDSFVGGASDGTYGVAAMDYRTDLGSDGVVETPVVSAKKAWFFFDDEFVALGTDINSSDAENDLYTNLNQSILDGNVVSSAGALAEESEATISGWAYHDGIGYVLPNGQTATIANKTQTNGDYSHKIFSMYLNHGKSVSDASYSYIVVPGATQADVAAYASDIPVEIISNTEDIQAVYHKELKILQAVFRKAGKLSLNGSEIAVDRPAIVMVKVTAGGYEITAQNPYNEKVAANFTVNERFDTFVNAYDAETGISTVDITPLNGLYAGKSIVKKLSKVFFTDANGNKVTALSPNAIVNINAEKALLGKATVIYVAVYGADGVLKKVENFTDFANESTNVITRQFTAPNNAAATDTVKVFAWNGDAGMSPVTKAQYMTK